MPDDIAFAAIINIVLQQQRQIDELKEIIKQKNKRLTESNDMHYTALWRSHE